ncbi:MAG: hypothetical protein IT387_09630 [Nitrospira sp.]|nr:hypothetical protein [Nitrospira sp.]
MNRTSRRLLMAVEACALAVGLLLCAADQFTTCETIVKVNLQEDLQQLFLLLKEESMLGEYPPAVAASAHDDGRPSSDHEGPHGFTECSAKRDERNLTPASILAPPTLRTGTLRNTS